jgi:crotonobetainyl-CoA:carnitine CoA-transferase CaiB-like acyl-CoA transferase
VVNRDQLIPVIAETVKHYTTDELGALLDEAGVPNAPLLNVGEVAVHPQTLALGMLGKCDGDELDLIGIPISFDGARPRSTIPAPRLGQHNDVMSGGDRREAEG